MKQKRTFVGLLLIVAILCLGIAYAVFDGTSLTINGSAEAGVASGKLDVVFTGAATATDAPEGTTATVDQTDATKASFKVTGLTTEGDTETVTFTVKNNTDGVGATLAQPTVTWANNNWFEVSECTYANASLAEAGAADNADTTTLTVTVRLKKTVATDADAEAAIDTVTIALNAEPAGNN